VTVEKGIENTPVVLQSQVLGEDHVGAVDARAVVGVAVYLAECSDCFCSEAARAKPGVIARGIPDTRTLTRQSSNLIENVRTRVEAHRAISPDGP